VTTITLENQILLEDGTSIPEKCDPCCQCPLRSKNGCCAGQSFNNHPTIQRLIMFARKATSKTPKSLSEIIVGVVQQSGNRMNFRNQQIVSALISILYRLPEITINKDNPKKPLYSRA